MLTLQSIIIIAIIFDMSETHVQYKINSNMHNFSKLEMKRTILSENVPYFCLFE